MFAWKRSRAGLTCSLILSAMKWKNPLIPELNAASDFFPALSSEIKLQNLRLAVPFKSFELRKGQKKDFFLWITNLWKENLCSLWENSISSKPMSTNNIMLFLKRMLFLHCHFLGHYWFLKRHFLGSRNMLLLGWLDTVGSPATLALRDSVMLASCSALFPYGNLSPPVLVTEPATFSLLRPLL